jgi:digeranylgeranylglycerophospholipid reductase
MRYDRRWRARFGREMDVSYLINQRIAGWSDPSWDEGVELLARLSPAQAAQLLRGDYSAGLFLGILRRNPSLLRTGARKFFDLALARMGRTTPVTEVEVANAG